MPFRIYDPTLVRTTTIIGLMFGCLNTGHADEPADSPTTESSNPAFVLRQGQFQSISSFENDDQTGKVYDNTGAESRSYNISEQRLTEQLRYGITDRFDVYGQGIYVPSVTTHSNPVIGPSTRFSSNGFEDPLFGVLWRALGQDRYMVNVDLGAAFAPNIVSGNLASTVRSGSVASGGSETVLNVSASRIEPTFTVYATLGANRFGTRTEENQTTLLSQTIEPYWQYHLDLIGYQHFGGNFSLVGGAVYTIQEGQNVTTTGGLPETAKPGNQSSVLLGLNYDVSPGTFLRLQDQYFIVANGSNTFPTLPINDTTTRDLRQNSVTLTFGIIF